MSRARDRVADELEIRNIVHRYDPLLCRADDAVTAIALPADAPTAGLP